MVYNTNFLSIRDHFTPTPHPEPLPHPHAPVLRSILGISQSGVHALKIRKEPSRKEKKEDAFIKFLGMHFWLNLILQKHYYALHLMKEETAAQRNEVGNLKLK